ncbi:hypothetical protein MK139_14450 [bacterium]|nr:hypothetical protein [bacterium]
MIHLPLHDKGTFLLSECVATLVEAVKYCALVVDRGLRRVDILRLLIRVQRTCTECDDAAGVCPDREDDSVPEAVVVSVPAVASEDEPRFLEDFRTEPATPPLRGGRDTEEVIPGLRCLSE